MADDNRPQAFMQAAKPTIWSRLGFGICNAPRPDDLEEAEEYAPSWFIVTTIARLDWRDRLRVLVTGRLMVDHAVKTDKPILRSLCTSAVSVLPPEHPDHG